MADESKYIICKRIDDQNRYFGLTLDELAPPLGVIILCWFFGSPFVGMCLGAVVFFSIRQLKKGQDANWLLSLMYWHLPDFVLRGILLNKTPSSSKRHWLS